MKKNVSTDNTNIDQIKLPQRKLNEIILILGFISALGPFSIDMYLPAFKSIAIDFNTDISRVSLSLTSYFIGISLGQLIYGPLLDRYGRKKPLIFGLGLYIISSIACSLSPSLYFLVIARFFSALGSCVGIVANRVIVKDLFPSNEVAKVFSTLILIMGIAPIVAPIICSFILFLGWRYIFALLAIISSLMLFSVIFFLPESRGEDKTVSLKIPHILLDYLSIIKNKTFLTYTLAGSIIMSGLFAYISASPFVYMELFQMSIRQYSLLFGLNSSMFILGSQINRVLLNKMTSQRVLFIISLIQVVSSLFLLLGNYFNIIGLPVTLALISVYLFGLGFNNPNSSALALASFKKNVGSASALAGSIQMLLSASSTVLVSYFHNGTAYPMFMIMALASIFSFIMILIGNRSSIKQ